MYLQSKSQKQKGIKHQSTETFVTSNQQAGNAPRSGIKPKTASLSTETNKELPKYEDTLRKFIATAITGGQIHLNMFARKLALEILLGGMFGKEVTDEPLFKSYIEKLETIYLPSGIAPNGTDSYPELTDCLSSLIADLAKNKCSNALWLLPPFNLTVRELADEVSHYLNFHSELSSALAWVIFLLARDKNVASVISTETSEACSAAGVIETSVLNDISHSNTFLLNVLGKTFPNKKIRLREKIEPIQSRLAHLHKASAFLLIPRKLLYSFDAGFGLYELRILALEIASSCALEILTQPYSDTQQGEKRLAPPDCIIRIVPRGII